MKFKPFQVLFVLLAGAAASAHAADTPGSNPSVRTPSASERMATARQAIAAKDWNRSISELRLAVRDEPRSAELHNLLAYSFRMRTPPDLAKAFDHYGTALKLDPRHQGAHEYIGEAYLMDRKPAEAEKHLEQLEAICGNRNCEPYQELAKSIAAYKARN